ncbi:MAG: bifunctional 4-hydroxy-2-oxoglutarate aldolase/2-dehydro-3-deoxy-phosphogluconate aldolase [Anaerolineae bacterium]|jgi:2-dehydro-3-deoxyphosphogluconate aldolase/(4S)-4-hydroxy-2-oxoglutarate aldolase|nr:bifunctional 4-hydroxy-2-oxoglutarate aldolase/2-dehydro-3-deoxy-phosphogluconate aldolase [Anaerolineae bacterium]
MTPETALDMILKDGMVAGVRGQFPPAVMLPLAETLLDEGIHCFELTMNSVEPIAAMQALKQRYGSTACVGMGTVLSVAMAQQVIDAGADFIMSPAFQPEVVEFVLRHNVLMIPGVITPTEAVNAWAMGVQMIKIFPIGALPLDYFKALFGPLSHMRFICNGAMNEKNTQELMQAGAQAVGMAAWLTGDGTWTESRLRSRARLVTNAIALARGETVTREA